MGKALCGELSCLRADLVILLVSLIRLIGTLSGKAALQFAVLENLFLLE